MYSRAHLVAPVVLVAAVVALLSAGFDSVQFSSTAYQQWQANTARPLLVGSVAAAVAAGAAIALGRRRPPVAWALVGMAVVALVAGLLGRNAVRSPWEPLQEQLDAVGAPPASTPLGTTDNRGSIFEVPSVLRLFTTTASPEAACTAMRERVEQWSDRTTPATAYPDQGEACLLIGLRGERLVRVRVATSVEAAKKGVAVGEQEAVNRLPDGPGTAVLVEVAARSD